MDENRPLDLFLQPSRRLLLISVFFMVLCAALLWLIPLYSLHKLFLSAVIFMGVLMELRSKILLMSSRSIIRVGYDGGLMDSDGNVSEVCWWYQRRSGEKTYAELYSYSRVWAEWVALDFGRWPWQFGRTVVIARDSLENPKDFQRLKRALRSR
jgi:hypothetical protein